MIELSFETGWQVWRPTESQDASGGPVETFAQIATIKGRMRPRATGASGLRQYEDGAQYVFGVYRFYCLPTDIQERDELRKNGKRYRVQFVNNVMTMEHHLEVDCDVIHA